jgi:hypothetical protein
MPAIALAIVAGAARPQILNAQGPDPHDPYIESISYGGTGCPQGTVGQTITPLRLESVLGFDAYVASSGPGVPITESRKSCQININIQIPAHSEPSKLWLVTRGFLDLPAGVVGTSSMTLYFAGQTPQHVDQEHFGPVVRGNYEHRAKITVRPQSRQSQVVPVNIKSSVEMAGPSAARAMMTVDYLIASLKSDKGEDHDR